MAVSPDAPLHTCLHLLYKQRERRGPQVTSPFYHNNTAQSLVKLFDTMYTMCMAYSAHPNIEQIFLINIYKTVT